MSEETNIPQEETQPTPPTKEEVISFYTEQIEVKKLQVELQELNARFAHARAEELKAMQFVANMTMQPETELVDHVVTEEDMQNNPELAEQGIKAGDTVQIPQPKERKLKK